MNHRAIESDYVRIHSANGDPYRILDVSRDATTEEVKSAYKTLALKFHPDRIKLPPNSNKDRNYDKLASDYRDKCASLFKLAAEACATLADPSRRAEYDRSHRHVESGTLVPYRAQTEPLPPHLRANDRGYDHRSYDDLELFYGGEDDYRDPYRAARGAPPPYRNEFERPQSAFGHRTMSNDQPRYTEPKQIPSSKVDPFAIFQEHFPSMGQGLSDDFFDLGIPSFGGHHGKNAGALDPISKLMSSLDLGGGDGHHLSPSIKGAWSQQRLTRRHTNRNGQVTMSRQQKTMMAMDAGDRGQILFESSFKVVGRQSPSSNFGGGGNDFGNSLPSGLAKGQNPMEFTESPMVNPMQRLRAQSNGSPMYHQESPQPGRMSGFDSRRSLMGSNDLVPYHQSNELMRNPSSELMRNPSSELMRRGGDPYALPLAGPMPDFNRLPAIGW